MVSVKGSVTKRDSIFGRDPEFSSSPVETFFNSLHAVKDAFVPLESGIQRAAKDLQSHWLGPKKGVVNLENFTQTYNMNRGHADNPWVQSCSIKKQSQDFTADERKKNSSIKISFKGFWGNLFQNSGNNRRSEMSRKGSKEREARSQLGVSVSKDDGLCTNCMHFALTWSLLLTNFMQGIPSPFKSVKKCFQKQCNDTDGLSSSRGPLEGNDGNERSLEDICPGSCSRSSLPGFSLKRKHKPSGDNLATAFQDKDAVKAGEALSLELLLGFVLDNLFQNLQKLIQRNQECYLKNCGKNDLRSTERDLCTNPVGKDSSPPGFNHLEVITGILKGRKADVDGLLVNLGFARMGGVPSMVGVSSEKDDCQDTDSGNREPDGNTASKLATGLLQIPLSNVERLRSTLSTVSLTELVELVTQIGRSSKDYPDKKKLFSVQDFFRYTQAEGRRFFEELDRDGDGQVTLEDIEIATRKRRLPRRYAREFLRRTRSHLFAKSFGWKQFLSLMEQKEPTILRAYTTLCLSKSGTLQKSQILTSLKSAGLPATEENAIAMIRCLNADMEGSISYGHFRNFMLLLPSERLEDDPRSLWFEAATVVVVAPPVEIPAESVLKSALAGGLACALSTSLMHPVDTMKTRVQASTLSFPELVSKLPLIGLQGLYRGSIPAILGQFSSHGLRTGIFEASKLLLVNIAPTVPEIQVQSLASFCSTILGTAVRIPCEVLKQRLQAGIFDNVGEAIVGTLHQDGIKGFFRGTGATLCREVPFYVAGMGLYEEAKKVTQQFLRRDLEPWETIVVGALSGGLAAVVTTPFDVMKTRMMTAPQGVPVTMTSVAFTILSKEGPLGLFKGAVPRFFWIAPLGAMNFAGYELAKKAMNKTEFLPADDQLRQKKLSKAG